VTPIRDRGLGVPTERRKEGETGSQVDKKEGVQGGSKVAAKGRERPNEGEGFGQAAETNGGV